MATTYKVRNTSKTQAKIQALKELVLKADKKKRKIPPSEWNSKQVLEELELILDFLKSLQGESFTSIAEICVYLDYPVDVVKVWKSKFREDQEVYNKIRMIETLLIARLEKLALEGRVSANTAIFLLKAKHKYIENHEKLINKQKNLPTQERVEPVFIIDEHTTIPLLKPIE